MLEESDDQDPYNLALRGSDDQSPNKFDKRSKFWILSKLMIFSFEVVVGIILIQSHMGST